MIAYELWETRSGNLMASYESADRAFAAVTRTAAKHGADSVTSFALLQAKDNDEPETVAVGQDLLALAERSLSAPA